MHRGSREVIEFARSKGGVVTRTEAVALGMHPSALTHLVDIGVLRRIRPGLFALAGARSMDDQVDLVAVCRTLGAVVSHESAAVIHKLDHWPHVKPTVSVTHRSTNRFPGTRVHQLTDLVDEHIEVIDSLPVTIPERTVIDLARTMSERRLERMVDNGVASGRLDLDRLLDLFGQLARRGKPGTVRLRSILSRRGPGIDMTDSELERLLLKLISDFGLPEPTSQFRAPWLAPTNGRVDLAYPGHKLVIEGDSRRWHMLLNSFENDRLRDNAAQLAGWRVLRFTWREIIDHPERVAATIRQAIRT